MDKGITILIIDDSRTILRALEQRLASEGFEVLAADSGRHASRLVVEKHPDLIISDLDGQEADAPKLSEGLMDGAPAEGIPKIVLTSLVTRADRERTGEGGTVYLSKMCRCSELVAEIRSLLSLPA
jgi:two-component system KDP operon response regulator KdpE